MMQNPQQTSPTAPSSLAALEALALRQSNQAEGSVASARTTGAVPTPATSQGVNSLCLLTNMHVTDNPDVRTLLKQVLQTGQTVIAFLKGTC